MPWVPVTPSHFPHERDALDYLSERFPDREPFHAWSNFEFIGGDGSMNEVDVLMVTPRGFFLVEIKNWAGTITGDQSTWYLERDGRKTTVDNPLDLANLKAKRLKGLLDQHRRRTAKQRIPFLEPVIFLSNPQARVHLPESFDGRVFLRREISEAKGIFPHLLRIDAGSRQHRGIDKPTARLVKQTLEAKKLGLVRPSRSLAKVGSYELQDDPYEGQGFQDWTGKHESIPNLARRVRIYSRDASLSDEEKRQLERAARREFQLLHAIRHPHIVHATEYVDHELGPAVVFDRTADAQRLDEWLRDRAIEASKSRSDDRPNLSLDTQLHLLGMLAETVAYAHEQGLFHRALNPRSIWVLDPESEFPRIEIGDWFLAHSHEQTTTRHGTTRHTLLVDEPATAYLAPELLGATDPDEILLDVFSLGALFFLLLTGRAPAASAEELRRTLAESQGLLPSTQIDGLHPELDELVHRATRGDATARFESVRDLLRALDDVQDALTEPETHQTNPVAAQKGDILHPGITVTARLGKGATAVAYQVHCDPRAEGAKGRPEQAVLKVALDPEHNPRLEEEAAALRGLRHPNIVQCYETLDLGGHAALLLESAGTATLADRLRSDGPESEYLQPFGRHLLEVVRELERQGVSHRDIKPANIGIDARGSRRQPHLLLFDFSLAGVPADNLGAGTPAYLDPFLGTDGRRRWDAQAERWAAAVTLYEMATGTLPRWGDGRSDPAQQDDLVVDVRPDRFEQADLRDGFRQFFEKALARSADARFDTTEQMLDAWNDVFRARPEEQPAAEETKPADTSNDDVATAGGPDSDSNQSTEPEDPDRWVDQPGKGRLDLFDVRRRGTLDTQLADLGLSVRAVNVMNRENVLTVEDLLRFPLFQLHSLRGVGVKTRNELSRVAAVLRDKLDVPATAPPTDAPDDDEVGPARLSLEHLQALLLPASERADRQRQVLAQILAFPEDESVRESVDEVPWPSQTDVASDARLTRARVQQIVAQARQRWAGLPALEPVRDLIAETLTARGGVETVQRLARELASSLGSTAVEPLRSRLAYVLVRAAHEAERTAAKTGDAETGPRWRERRRSRDDAAPLILLGSECDAAGTFDGKADARFDAALALATAADELCCPSSGPQVVGPERAAERFEHVARGTPLDGVPAARLRQLACDGATQAALSARGEVYPRGLPAARALELSMSNLIVERITRDEIRRRVASRYPEAEPLPTGPELDHLLGDVGFPLVWNAGHYELPEPPTSSATSFGLATRLRTGSTTQGTSTPSPDVDQARDFEERLLRFGHSGSFLVLNTELRHAERAWRELTGSGRFAFEAVDLEARFVEALQAAAEARRVDWQVVLRADAERPATAKATPSRNWRNLQRLVAVALEDLLGDLLGDLLAASPRTDDDRAEPPPLLVRNLGWLARYDRVDWLEQLRTRLESADPPRALCLFNPTNETATAPRLDDAVLPVLSAAQWARVPAPWLENVHRAAGDPRPADGAPAD